MKRWKRPPEFRRGWTLGPSIIVPVTVVEAPLDARGFLDKDLDGRDVVWLPPPTPGNNVTLATLFSKPWVAPEGWLAEGSQVIG